jgi:hypothetical protein
MTAHDRSLTANLSTDFSVRDELEFLRRQIVDELASHAHGERTARLLADAALTLETIAEHRQDDPYVALTLYRIGQALEPVRGNPFVGRLTTLLAAQRKRLGGRS